MCISQLDAHGLSMASRPQVSARIYHNNVLVAPHHDKWDIYIGATRLPLLPYSNLSGVTDPVVT